MTPVHSSLPNGVNATLPLAQFRRIWQIWFALAPIAASRGEGIEITEEATGTYAVASVYAPQWESVRVVVIPDGTPVWCSEQSAPDMPSVDFTAPPPPAPWEKEGFEDRCSRRKLAEIHEGILAILVAHGKSWSVFTEGIWTLGAMVYAARTGSVTLQAFEKSLVALRDPDTEMWTAAAQDLLTQPYSDAVVRAAGLLFFAGVTMPVGHGHNRKLSDTERRDIETALGR